MVRSQLPAQVANSLRWNDVPRTSRIFFSQNCNIFSTLVYLIQVYLSITQAKQIINLLLLGNFYPVMLPINSEMRRIVVYEFGHSLWSAVSCQRKWLIAEIVSTRARKVKKSIRKERRKERGWYFIKKKEKEKERKKEREVTILADRANITSRPENSALVSDSNRVLGFERSVRTYYHVSLSIDS